MDGREYSDVSFEVADLLAGESHTIPTKYGPLKVTLMGSKTKSACIAYHEVGLNHSTCFHSLVVASGPQSLLLKNFCMIFIDAPGCQDPSAEVPEQAQPVTMEKLALQVQEVVKHFDIKECVGLGVGNGAYVLLKCAIDCPNLFAGLVLISPSCQQASWWEWTAGQVAATHLKLMGWTSGATNHLTQRLFSPATIQMLGGQSDLIKGFYRDVKYVNPRSAASFLLAALSRPSLVPQLAGLRCRILLLFGDQGLYDADSLELARIVDKTRLAVIEMSQAGVLINEERPLELTSPLQLFFTALQLEGIGLGGTFPQVGT